MEIRGVPIKKELIEKYKNDPCISKLYFYLLRNDSKEAESYFKSIIKVLNTLNIPYEEEITFSFNDAKEKITKANLNKKITSIVVTNLFNRFTVFNCCSELFVFLLELMLFSNHLLFSNL